MSLWSRQSQRRKSLGFGGIALFALAVALGPSCSRHAKAASLLLRFGSNETPCGLAALGMVEVDERAGILDTPTGRRRMKIYSPRGVASAPGLVLIHGVHRLGIDEPRLVRFARALASAGACVMTPEVEELTDYRIDYASLATIGAAARALGPIVHRRRVGVLGFSFAGGLSLLAASDPAFEPSIAFVVSIGGHHDLARVARFFATDAIEAPDGSVLHLHAHDYGMLVLIYGYTGEFFSGGDAPAAHAAVGLWLAGERDAAKERAGELSAEGHARIQLLFDERGGELAPALLASVARHDDELRAVSPNGHLASLSVPVYLLHGEGDSVIPPTESRWVAHDLPPGILQSMLISKAIEHVELRGKPSIGDQAAVVHFMAQILESALDEPAAP